MSKLIKICKVTCIVFVFGLFAYLVFSIILLAEAAFFYLIIHFVEKWCIKNDIQ